MTLAEIAELIDARVHGDPSKAIEGLATLGSASSQHLSFFVNPRYLNELKSTCAGAVLIKAEHVGDAPCDALQPMYCVLLFRLNESLNRYFPAG